MAVSVLDDLAASEGRSTGAAIRRFRAGDLVNDPTPEPPDLWQGVLRAGARMVMAGPPKSLKTYLSNDMAFGFALGLAVLGYSVTRPLRVFYAQAEMSWFQSRERARRHPKVREAMDLDGGELLNENLVITDRFESLLFDDYGVEATIEAIREDFPNGLDVIIVDALAAVYSEQSEDDNAQMQRFLGERVGALREAFPGVATIIIHHTTKVRLELLLDDPFLAIRGAGALRGWYDTGIVMHAESAGSPRRTVHFEMRDNPPIDPLTVELVDGELVRVDAPEANTYGGKPAQIEWEEVLRLLKLGVHERGEAYTVRGFARVYGGMDGPLGVSRDNLAMAINHEAAKPLGGRLALFENPLRVGPLGAEKRPVLVVPAGCALGIDQSRVPPRYHFKGAK